MSESPMAGSLSAERTTSRWWTTGLVAAGVLIADQTSKAWAVRTLGGSPIEVFWTLRMRLAFNNGAAFSIGSGRGDIISGVVVLVAVAVLFTGRNERSLVGSVGRGLVVGGALGNLADRLSRANSGFMSGAVVDFIDLQWWPVFNVADMGVVIGGLLVGYALLRPKPADSPAEVSAGSASTP